MASLFGKNRLREIAQKIDTKDILPHIDIIQRWCNDYHHGSLKFDKETSREQQYNRDFFLTILGYEEKPASPYSFEPKASTVTGQLPDAVISYTDKANDVENISAVVELKGANIDLDRPQRREGNMSPVQQGFKYKAQYRSVPFVIVSNFWEFRLYRDNLLDYENWTLDELVNPTDDYLSFKTWYVLLRNDNFTTPKGTSKTEAILSDIRIEQENIGKKFYKVYREARIGLLRDIIEQNQIKHKELDLAIEKAQKIIDRIVFTAFAEDRGLLPDDTLQRIIKVADNSELGISLWDTLKSVFNAIDRGSDKLDIPNGYNGGLFKHDDTLNNLHIGDGVLRKVVELGTYNFSEDLSVNILGHIFEQSISDLEEIKNKVNESQNLETIMQSRRKKDGIFYTPDYIVRYIVDNSLGAYLRDHEEKFKTEFGLKGDINDKNYEKREKQAYTKYQDFLQNIKVVDPACGSGAFLVYVFDYLLAENKRIGDILGNTLFGTDEYVRDILRNNIYGVDLNEESVEITKLSLWLKTAQKGKKLTTLDDNIKCGNSLINDPEVAGDKAFDWQRQFANIFRNGGFDVVVGNPPYVSVELMDAEDKDYYRKRYQSFYKRSDLFALFLENSTGMLREDGYLSFIMPSVFLTNLSYAKARDMLLENNWLETVCYTGGKVFADATVDTTILVVRKNNNETIRLQDATHFHDIQTHDVKSGYFAKYNNVISIGSRDSGTITDKMFSEKFVKLGKHVTIFQGIVTGNNTAFTFASENEALAHGIERELLHPLCFGRDISKWHIDRNNNCILYLDKNIDIKQYPGSERWLMDFKDNLELRRECRRGVIPWYSLQWPRKQDELNVTPKILLQRTRNESLKTRIVATIARESCYMTESIYTIIPKSDIFSLWFVLGLLNSSLINYLFATKFLNLAIKADYLKDIQIPSVHDEMYDSIARAAEAMTQLHCDLNKQADQFSQLIMHEYSIEKWPTKLNKWWTLDFANFVKALKFNLSLAQKDDLFQLFEKYRTECAALDSEIQKTDHEIDQLVYKLYGLTPGEIALVERVDYE